MLICLNHAIKLTKVKTNKSLELMYKSFEELGKIKHVGTVDTIEYIPKILIACESPLSIMVKEVEEKYKGLIERGYWKLNANEKLVYNIMQNLRYRL